MPAAAFLIDEPVKFPGFFSQEIWGCLAICMSFGQFLWFKWLRLSCLDLILFIGIKKDMNRKVLVFKAYLSAGEK